jgi:general secretion pathway protein G
MKTYLAIAALLAFLASLSYHPISDPSRRSRRVAAFQIEAFQEALKAYAHDNGDFPNTQQGLEALRIKPPGARNWNGPYLSKDIPPDFWGRPFQYQYPGQHGPQPDIVSFGADGRPGGEGIDADIVSWKN